MLRRKRQTQKQHETSLPLQNDHATIYKTSRFTSTRYIAHLIFVICFILIFGTIYSDITARDPCKVLSEETKPTPSTIPKLYHYQSKHDILTPETKSWNTVLNISIKMTYPNITPSSEWRGVYWSDESCHNLVHDHYPDFIATYDGFKHVIQRVDACRYLILKKYGGVYADTDISLHMKDIINLIPDDVGVVESPYRYNENVQNSLMTSPKDHVFWDVAMEIMVERGGSDAILSTTGPKMLDDAMKRYKGDVHVLPCELFQRLPLGQLDTTFLNVLGREVLSRAIPMKGCGRYGDGICEVTRHSGKASWTKESGKIA